MKIYADTSALIAWFHPADEFAEAVTDWCRDRSPEFCWNSVLRIELRHNLRRLTGRYATIAWQAYRSSETSRKLKLESDRLSVILDRADELSSSHCQASRTGTWDFVHVAAAQIMRVEVFITCDEAQADLAKTSGISRVQLL